MQPWGALGDGKGPLDPELETELSVSKGEPEGQWVVSGHDQG